MYFYYKKTSQNMYHILHSIKFKQYLYDILPFPDLAIEIIMYYLKLAVDLNGYTNFDLKTYIIDYNFNNNIDTYLFNKYKKKIYNSKKYQLIDSIQKFNIPIELLPFDKFNLLYKQYKNTISITPQYISFFEYNIPIQKSIKLNNSIYVIIRSYPNEIITLKFSSFFNLTCYISTVSIKNIIKLYFLNLENNKYSNTIYFLNNINWNPYQILALKINNNFNTVINDYYNIFNLNEISILKEIYTQL